MSISVESVTVKSLCKQIETLPFEHIQLVHEFVRNLGFLKKPELSFINDPNSFINNPVLKIDKKDWTREDLYADRVKKQD
jgi:hypothetical protein